MGHRPAIDRTVDDLHFLARATNKKLTGNQWEGSLIQAPSQRPRCSSLIAPQLLIGARDGLCHPSALLCHEYEYHLNPLTGDPRKSPSWGASGSSAPPPY